VSLAVAAGFAALFCMDRVYGAMARERRPRLDGVAAVTSALFLAGVLAMQPWLALAAGAVHLAGFVERTRRRETAPGPGAWPLAVARVAIGLVVPLTAVLTATAPLLAAAAALAGEILDRAHFYGSLEVTTPRGRMATDLAARRAEGARA
jgi:hypothetical protein